jgi:hypothetical protein
MVAIGRVVVAMNLLDFRPAGKRNLQLKICELVYRHVFA